MPTNDTDVLDEQKAALYLIPVPLGSTNERVLPSYNAHIIVGIKHFIVENIRSARRFLSSVRSPFATEQRVDTDSAHFFELNEHTALSYEKISMEYLEPLKQGFPMGIISEAGCPAIADPGAVIVKEAQRLGLRVVPLVGPSSIVLSLMASGFNGQNFAFTGYVPIKNAERTKKIRTLEEKAYREDQTQICIEAPYRNLSLFEALLSVCKKDTLLCIAAGLTTQEEFICTKSIASWKKSPVPHIQKVPAIFLLYHP